MAWRHPGRRRPTPQRAGDVGSGDGSADQTANVGTDAGNSGADVSGGVDETPASQSDGVGATATTTTTTTTTRVGGVGSVEGTDPGTAKGVGTHSGAAPPIPVGAPLMPMPAPTPARPYGDIHYGQMTPSPSPKFNATAGQPKPTLLSLSRCGDGGNPFSPCPPTDGGSGGDGSSEDTHGAR